MVREPRLRQSMLASGTDLALVYTYRNASSHVPFPRHRLRPVYQQDLHFARLQVLLEAQQVLLDCLGGPVAVVPAALVPAARRWQVRA